MSGNSTNPINPNAKDALNRMKYEVARDIGVNLTEGDNGDNTARENGSVGGFMVKRMFDQFYQKHGGTITGH